MNVKPETPVQPIPEEPVRTKESKTEVRIDSVTGSQVVTTNDIKVIKETPIIQNVVKRVVEDSKIEKNSVVVNSVTKTSENKIQTTFIVQ